MSNDLFYQVVADDLIVEFGNVDDSVASRMRPTEPSLVRRVKDPALYGFLRADRVVHVADSKKLTPILQGEFDQYIDRPHLRYSIAKFIGDKGLIEDAETSLRAARSLRGATSRIGPFTFTHRLNSDNNGVFSPGATYQIEISHLDPIPQVVEVQIDISNGLLTFAAGASHVLEQIHIIPNAICTMSFELHTLGGKGLENIICGLRYKPSDYPNWGIWIRPLHSITVAVV